MMKTLHCSLGLALVLAGCGGPYSQTRARDLATIHSCDWYAHCNEIGPGKTYQTRDECEVKVRASWTDAWPAAECDNKIRPDDLDICLKAIDITSCGNFLDLYNTLANKCSKAQVCKGP